MTANRISYILASLGVLLSVPIALSYQDHIHHSKVFEEAGLTAERAVRIFLPKDYGKSQERYPVIYVFHGYGGRYDVSPSTSILTVEEARIFKNKEIVYPIAHDELDRLVKEDNSYILVMWNGRSEPGDSNPYNDSPTPNLKYQVQFADYFLELVSHMDGHFRTLPNRAQRGLFGHSQGGFMAWFIAARFPDQVGAAVNNMGATEQYLGWPENMTANWLRNEGRNLHGVYLRHHNGVNCYISKIQAHEVRGGMLREEGLEYDYKVYPTCHAVGIKTREEASSDITLLKDGIAYLNSCFENPLPEPVRWHHTDMYPDFSVWGYRVKSALSQPGFVELEGVTRGGFQVRTRQWLPDGPLIPGVSMEVRTGPVYSPREAYTLLDYNETRGTQTFRSVRSDAEGRISLPRLNHESHHIGLYRKGDPAEIVVVSHRTDKGAFLYQGEEGRLSLQILNRGGSGASGVTARLHATPGDPWANDLEILTPVVEIGRVPQGGAMWTGEFTLKLKASAKPPAINHPLGRLNVTFTDDENRVWKDEVDLALFYEVPEFGSDKIVVYDGKPVDTSPGEGSDRFKLGQGNGNGMAEPGETIALGSTDNTDTRRNLKRLRLYADDPYIEETGVFSEFPLIEDPHWYDGINFASLFRVSEDCPPGHTVNILACYFQVPPFVEGSGIDYRERDFHWGRVKLIVGKGDTDF